ncbi:MAG: KOW motif-containing protein [Candidatus Njordarchaeales archaeon]
MEDSYTEYREREIKVEEKSDRKFFAVKVPAGRELQLIFLIKWRTELLKLPIYSAFTIGSGTGVVIVEADNYDSVVRAVKNFRYAAALPDELSFEDIEQYLEGFEVKYERAVAEKEEVKIEQGMIVEIIDGPFKGQKARVVSVGKKKAWVDLMGGGALLVEVDINHLSPIRTEKPGGKEE